MEVLLGVAVATTSIFAFIAMMCTWANTGKTAECVEKIWVAHANELRLDPKTGKELPQEKKA